MSSLYYVGVSVMSLAQSIYNFEMYAEGKNVTCYECQGMNDEELKEYLGRLNTTTAINCTNRFKYWPNSSVLVKQTDVYQIMACVIAVMALLMVLFAGYNAIVLNMFSNQTPDDYLSISKCKKFSACIVKIMRPCLLILSWINFILIVVDWILYDIKYCNEAIDKTPAASLDKYHYRKKHLPLMITNSIIWILLHCGGSIVRAMTYEEPFAFDPPAADWNCCKALMLKQFGP